ncbi:MAG: arylsulfatase [Chloroflexi bacterium]|nr:arylsulfatase [Chloroflexota bacterium]
MMADDMGYSDLGCFGSEISTPNIDALARRGARFTQFYNCARCCPTRASLLTGLYPHEAGVGHMTTDLRIAGYRGYLSRNAVTIAEALRPAGYRTLMSGKWHVGGDYLMSNPDIPSVGSESWPQPTDRGFERFFGTLTGAGSYFSPHTLTEDGEPLEAPEGFYYTDAIADRAVDYIGEYGSGEDPFFLYVAFTAPHWPLHALEEDIERYRGRYREGWEKIRQARHEEQKGMGILDESWPISKRDPGQRDWDAVVNQDWEDARMAVYAAQIDRMDQGVGRIVAKLEQMEIAENTLVMFLSDNGACAEFLKEDGFFEFSPTRTRDGSPMKLGNAESVLPGPENTYMSYDISWANASNSPFRRFKHWTHEGGISTPFIACWPEMIRPGLQVDSPCHLIDVMPTCLAAAGAAYPGTFNDYEVRPLRGQSLLEPFQDAGWSRDGPIYWEHEGNQAVRLGQWKLVRRYPGDWELYDLSLDRTEQEDLAASNRARLAELVGLYDGWAPGALVVPWEQIIARDDMAYQRQRLQNTASTQGD